MSVEMDSDVRFLESNRQKPLGRRVDPDQYSTRYGMTLRQVLMVSQKLRDHLETPDPNQYEHLRDADRATGLLLYRWGFKARIGAEIAGECRQWDISNHDPFDVRTAVHRAYSDVKGSWFQPINPKLARALYRSAHDNDENRPKASRFTLETVVSALNRRGLGGVEEPDEWLTVRQIAETEPIPSRWTQAGQDARELRVRRALEILVPAGCVDCREGTGENGADEYLLTNPRTDINPNVDQLV